MLAADAVNHKAAWVWVFPAGYAVYYVVRYHIIRVLKAWYRRASGRAEGVNGARTRPGTAQAILTGGDLRSTTADLADGRVRDDQDDQDDQDEAVADQQGKPK